MATGMVAETEQNVALNHQWNAFDGAKPEHQRKNHHETDTTDQGYDFFAEFYGSPVYHGEKNYRSKKNDQLDDGPRPPSVPCMTVVIM